MLLEANTFTRSAPSSFSLRTAALICSGSPVCAVIGCNEVNKRGPGMIPRLIASRSGLSAAEPTLWTVVNPPRSVAHALPSFP